MVILNPPASGHNCSYVGAPRRVSLGLPHRSLLTGRVASAFDLRPCQGEILVPLL
jgi:hypothetical protein